MAALKLDELLGNFDVQFGIRNAAAVMATNGDVGKPIIQRPIFAHPTYAITTTLDAKYNNNGSKYGVFSYKDAKETKPTYNGKSYMKVFRKEVEWDFGDGTTVRGYSATHSYSKPGKYTITCTFFDIKRQGYINGYSVQVIVKDVIPTKLAISNYREASSLNSVLCSAVNTIAEIEACLSTQVSNHPNVIAERIFNEDETVLDHWNDVKDSPYPHLQKYYTFVDGEWDKEAPRKLFIDRPVTYYTPDYQQIYGKFYPNGKDMAFSAYRIEPFMKVIENTKSGETLPLTINNPNSNILTEGKEPMINVEVQLVSSESELPRGVLPVGKRAIFNLEYKSDFISSKDVITIHYDLELMEIFGYLKSGTNYLNIPPLGMHFPVKANAFASNSTQTFFYSLSNTGFDYAVNKPSDDVMLSLVKDYTYTCYLIPYIIPSEGAATAANGVYYIPKDFDFWKHDVSVSYRGKNDSVVTIDRHPEHRHIMTVKLELGTVLDAVISLPNGVSMTLQKELYDLDALRIPTEKYYKQNIDDLLEAYLPHIMFKETPMLKQMLKNVFDNNRILDYLVTKGVNFFDDNANIDTVYIKQMLSILTMMGHEVTEYNTTNFDGVNELRDIARILSMNYTKLMGNKVYKEPDIRVSANGMGENVGDKIEVDDILYVYTENSGRNLVKGKVYKIERDGKVYNLEEPTVLIAADDYTEEVKTVTFSDLEPFAYVTEGGKRIGKYKIADYLPEWGWNLLLPEQYAEKDKARIVNSYYSFYLLKPSKEVIRIGNYLDPDTIQEEFDNIQNWLEKDGLPERVVQKILFSKGKLRTLGLSAFNLAKLYLPSDEAKANAAMVVKLELEKDNQEVSLGNWIINGLSSDEVPALHTDCSIDWGDGSNAIMVDNVDEKEQYDKLRHVYPKKGTYYIHIKGCVCIKNDDFGFDDLRLRSLVTEISIPKGCVSPIFRTYGGFGGFTKLKSVSDNIFENVLFSEHTRCTLRGAFLNCANLEKIPAGVPAVIENNDDLELTFAGCKKLKKVAENFLEKIAQKHPEGISMDSTFFDSGIEELPKGFFSYFNEDAELFLFFTFSSCNNLKSAPQYWKTIKAKCEASGVFHKCNNMKNLNFAPKEWK